MIVEGCRSGLTDPPAKREMPRRLEGSNPSPSARTGRALTGRALFRAVAPRLERAHRERKVEMVLERRARRSAREAEMSAERLVAHRELQLVRAAGRCKSRTQGHYLTVRHRKLEAAREELARARSRSKELGC